MQFCRIARKAPRSPREVIDIALNNKARWRNIAPINMARLDEELAGAAATASRCRAPWSHSHRKPPLGRDAGCPQPSMQWRPKSSTARWDHGRPRILARGKCPVGFLFGVALGRLAKTMTTRTAPAGGFRAAGPQSSSDTPPHQRHDHSIAHRKDYLSPLQHQAAPSREGPQRRHVQFVCLPRPPEKSGIWAEANRH